MVAHELLQPRVGKARSTTRFLIASMRPHQWVKNLFILAPLLFGQKLGDLWAIGQACLTFASFCLTASAIYLINDLGDASHDRAHPEKRRRPIASAAVPGRLVLYFACILLVTASFIICQVGPLASGFLAAYGGLMLGYCFVIKRILVLDCMAIAAGFVLRVVCGAAAVAVVPSHWLIMCTFLLALFLAFAKRRQELLVLSSAAAEHRHVLRGYSIQYLDQVITLLGGAAVVCYVLYTMAPETVVRFHTGALIYGTGFVVYGLLRYLALLQHTVYGGDPSRVLVRDKPLLLATLAWAGYNAIVIYQSSLVALWIRLAPS